MRGKSAATFKLNADERDQLRLEMHEREKESNRLVGVYLSALVVVAGWLIGRDVGGLLDLIYKNGGINFCAFLIVAIVNLVFH